MRKFIMPAIAAVVAGALITTPALAQRDPAYAAARAAGEVGQKMYGYRGIVGAPTHDLKTMVDDLNIKRKAVYAQQAQAQHATVEEYALTAGCLAIARTVPGEKYQAPDGSWATRTSAPPRRDPRCP